MKSILQDELPNPVIVYDSKWKINKINTSALTILGYSTAGELDGRHIKDILHESEHGVMEAYCRHMETNKNDLICQDINHLRKDGEQVRISSHFGIIRGKEGKNESRYVQSGFYTGEETLRDQPIKKLHCLKILAENVPGLMMILIDKNHEIQCSVGSEKKKSKSKNEEAKMLEERLPGGIIGIIQPLLDIAFEGTSVSREFNYENEYYSVRLIPINDQNSADLCVIILHNITETKIIENKLKVSKEAAEAANEAKSVFIAKMSHEIRTPLNAIMGFIGLLKKTKLTKKQSTYLEVVNNSSHHLLSTIDDILLLSRIESGRIEPALIEVDEEPFSVEKVINAVKDVFELRVREKNLYLQIKCNPAVKEMLIGDPAKIRQVLMNLVGNAIKFTHKGGIVLNCSVIYRTNEKLTIRFDISDSGIGIKADELNRIFEPFHQVDNSQDRNYFGSGLGLTISKNIVKSMGGEISVVSSPEKGSTFSFTLSFKKSKTQLPGHDYYNSLIPTYLPDHVRILYTDDDPVSRMLGKVILNHYKARCVFAGSGEEAVKKFKPGRFNIILLDINMPGTSGVDVAKHIRKIESSNKNLPHTKIIAMTANVLGRHIKEYINAGMDDFILKPFSEADLIEKIVAHISPSPIPSKTRKTSIQLSENKGYDLNELLRITRGNKKYTVLMLNTFLENGKETLGQMKKSFKKGDYRSIAEAAHRLQPSVEQLGLKETARLLKQIGARYLKETKVQKDSEMIEHALNEIELCIEKISLAKDEFEI